MSQLAYASHNEGRNSFDKEMSGSVDSSLEAVHCCQLRESTLKNEEGEVERFDENETRVKRRTLIEMKKQGFIRNELLPENVLDGNKEDKFEDARLSDDSGVLSIETTLNKHERHLEVCPGSERLTASQVGPERSQLQFCSSQIESSQRTDYGQGESLRKSDCGQNILPCQSNAPGVPINNGTMVPPISVTMETDAVLDADNQGQVTSSNCNFQAGYSPLRAKDKGLLVPAGSQCHWGNPDSGISSSPESTPHHICFDFSPRVLGVLPTGYVEERCRCSATNIHGLAPPHQPLTSDLLHCCRDSRSDDTVHNSTRCVIQTVSDYEAGKRVHEMKRNVEGIVCDGKIPGCQSANVISPFHQNQIQLHPLPNRSHISINNREPVSPKLSSAGSSSSSPFYLPSPPLVSKNNFDQLTRELLKVKDDRQSLAEKNEKLHLTIQNLMKSKTDLEESCHHLNNQLEITGEKVKMAQKENEQQCQEMAKVKMEKMYLEQKFQDQGYELRSLKEKVEEMEKELSLQRQNRSSVQQLEQIV